ncbi:MAG: DUF6055 domain-containing protein [Holophagaceae bacterium]|nr:DUF6055 domain-containing protein [Holophagaceae bacterium]
MKNLLDTRGNILNACLSLLSLLVPRHIMIVLAIFSLAIPTYASGYVVDNDPPIATIKAEKELFIPSNVNRVPEGNDFNDPDSQYCHQRSAVSENFAIFWAKEYGDDPSKHEEQRMRFDVQDILKECERFYDAYVNKFKYLIKGNSVSDKYKSIIWIIESSQGTAFGGGSENVGMMWCPVSRISRNPYCTAAHELGHSFQYMLRQDGGRGVPGGYNEMQAQWFLWNVYPEWMTIENYHLVNFMKETHFAFLHGTNIYRSPYVLEYWTNKHGVEFMGKLSREVEQGEDAVAAYKRVNNVTQSQFNAEMYDAYARFMTWDMSRIREVAKPYANQHFTTLNKVKKDWYRIATDKCPQNYGYNGIKLNVPAAGKTVTIDFNGIAGAEGFEANNIDKAGWRYGFVAYKKNGERVYSPMFSKAKGKSKFKVPADTEYLWLVVMGAPTEHWANPAPQRRQPGQGQDAPPPPPKDAQWPYEFKLVGTTLDPAMVQ